MASRQRLQISGVLFFLTSLACFIAAFADDPGNPANGWFIAVTEGTKLDRYSTFYVNGTGPQGYKETSNLRAYVEAVGPSGIPVGQWIEISDMPLGNNIWSHALQAPSGDWGTTQQGNNGTVTIWNCAVMPWDKLCGPVNVRFEDL
jgi:hypothetical protein